MILGAAGQIAKMLTDDLLAQTDFDLVLYGRNVSSRLSNKANDRVSLVDGEFEELDKIREHLNDVDAVYLNYVAGDDLIKPLVKVLEESSVEQFIAASVPDLYQESEGKLQAWYRANSGIMWEARPRKAADIIEASKLDYVILRITWLYDEEGNTHLRVSGKGEPFVEAQGTRQAVAQFITSLLTGQEDYHRANLGLGEPGLGYLKPSFHL